MTTYTEDARRVWKMDHDGYPDSQPHDPSSPDAACPFCKAAREALDEGAEPWELEYQSMPDPEVGR